MLKNKRILVISSHPDDEAICSGGLIMRAKAEKAKVYVLYMATGTSRQFVNGKTEEKERIIEAEQASILGNFHWGIGFTKISTLVDTLPQKYMIEMIENVVKKFKPKLVVIPNRNSYSQDHRAVAQACISALRPIPSNLHPQPDMILEVEEPTSWPVASQPNFFVDITNYMEDKIDLYACHKSQFTKDPQYRSPQNLRRLAGFRGSEIGVKYAEAYNLLKYKI